MGLKKEEIFKPMCCIRVNDKIYVNLCIDTNECKLLKPEKEEMTTLRTIRKVGKGQKLIPR